ncbi:hypothetical protein [Candidatus Nitrosocosmicus hydrocola]|uniref:hypothetical protein n=1 Tax=Candidatus Nitrosocosmicus hydrocola TaxID=1826872 RepID=UPI0013737DF1|nr:hypothetical protein [Candidatus Nitrosocosmicus hydrocola]
MKKYAPTGLSLPVKLMNEIDLQRGDVSRSRFILRMIQKVLETPDNEVNTS